LSTKLTPTELLARPQNCCIVCGPDNPRGLQLQFTTLDDESVEARWEASPDFEGYTGVLHGGIICTLLDEAMAKAVITHGWRAMTVELKARYRHHVSSGEQLVIQGWVTERKRRKILTEAVVRTAAGSERARATGTFLTVE
jgi:uncharacterized protein (TIGR00369 family)